MDNGIELLDTVALTADVPQLNLRRGQVGTVVEVLAESRAFEVEFCDREGRTYASLGLQPDQLRVVRSASAAQHDLPSHAFEPPFPRADPLFQNVIDVARHGFAEEEQLTEEVKRFIAASREPIQLQDSMLRDGELYLLVTIGVGIATNFISDLIRFLVRRLRDEYVSRQAPVIYISPSFAPKRTFRLPEEAEKAEQHFKQHPSRQVTPDTTEWSSESKPH